MAVATELKCYCYSYYKSTLLEMYLYLQELKKMFGHELMSVIIIGYKGSRKGLEKF